MARTRRSEASAADFAPATEKRPGAKAFAEIAGRSKSFRPARETLRRVRAVPTIFPDYDRRTRVGGHPIDRVAFVHGPSSHGKTVFVNGLGYSFLRRGHMFALVDAEMTTPITWLETLFGEYVDDPRFVASRPRSYEQAVDDVRRVAEGLAESRIKRRVPEETTCLFAIDSVRKLVPEDLIARIKKMGAEGEKGSVDGFGGAAGRMRAALNAAWLDELVPLMHHTGCGIVFVGRETEDPNADANDRKFGRDWKVGGGKALVYDSSLQIRVSRAGYAWVGPDGEKRAVGERHRVEIIKTKVAAHQDKVEEAYFHTSNGSETAEGFDRARDLLRLGEDLGVVRRSGAWVSAAGTRWNGEPRYVRTVRAEQLDRIEEACRAKFADDSRGVTVGGES